MDTIEEEKTSIESLDPEAKQKPVIDGSIIIDGDVVASIAGLVASEVEGVVGLGKSSIRSSVFKHLLKPEDSAKTGVEVEVGRKEAILDLELGVVYGYYIPDVVNEVRRKVAARLKETTGLVAKEINVRVVNIKLPNKKKEK